MPIRRLFLNLLKDPDGPPGPFDEIAEDLSALTDRDKILWEVHTDNSNRFECHSLHWALEKLADKFVLYSFCSTADSRFCEGIYLRNLYKAIVRQLARCAEEKAKSEKTDSELNEICAGYKYLLEGLK